MPKLGLHRTCSVAKCGRRHSGHGYCEMHLDRVRKHGSTELPKKEPRRCCIDGCMGKVVAKGYCGKHYQRVAKRGDPNYVSVSARMDDFITNVALTYTKESCLNWPFRLTQYGYAAVKRRRKQILVHRMLCEHFNGPPPTPTHHAAHDCGNAACVNPRHIAWKTPAENLADKERHGTSNHGTRNGASKLTEDQVRSIRGLKGHLTQRAIAAKFGVTDVMVSRIHRRKEWGWLP